MIVIKADYDTYQECGKNKADKKILRLVFRMIQQINLRKRAFHGKFYSHNKSLKPHKPGLLNKRLAWMDLLGFNLATLKPAALKR